ncbi:hypothetical protein Tco_1097391 [Tanacetum coccineum]
MLVQSTKDEGATSETLSEPQPTPSPPHPSEANVEPQTDPSPRPSPTPHIPDSIPEVSGGNQGGQSSSDRSKGGMTLQSVYVLCISLCTQVTDQAKEIKHLKALIKKLKKQAKPVITHHRAWMKSVSLKQRLAGKKSLKSNWMQKESVSKQGRMSAKVEPSVHKDPLFDELDERYNVDYMETDRLLKIPNVSTDRPKVSTDKEKDSTVSPNEGTDDRTEGRSATPTTPTTTPTMFGDDETIAQVLLNMSQAKAVSREKEKRIDSKRYEGKRKLKREDSLKLNLKEAEEEVKKLAEEEAIKAALSNEYDFIQARMEADRLLALRLQDEEREKFTVEERAKFLHDTIAAQKNHVGNKKHSDLKNKTFEEIQALYEKVKRFDESFIVVGSTEDERRIKEVNEGVKDTNQKRLKEEDTTKVPAKIMMESSTEENDQSDFWSNQQDWKIVTWRLYEACRVCILEFEDGTVIHMLVERRYPFSKDLLQRESTVAFDLIRFIKQ